MHEGKTSRGIHWKFKNMFLKWQLISQYCVSQLVCSHGFWWRSLLQFCYFHTLFSRSVKM